MSPPAPDPRADIDLEADAAGFSAKPSDPPLDRGISPIAGGLSAGRLGKGVVFGALLAGCAAVAASGWRGDHPRPARPDLRPVRQVVAYEPPPTLDHPGPDAPRLAGEGPSVPAIEPTAAVSAPGQQPFGGVAWGAATKATTAWSRAPRPAPLLAYSQSAAPPDAGARTNPEETATVLPAEASALDRLRQASPVRSARARRLGERRFLILAGAAIPCLLQTALDSGAPGAVNCVIPTDVWSDEGTVVLLAKGTRVLGEARGGLRQGQRRLFVLWTRAVTPDGVAIALASPAADALGRAGLDGEVDSRFWDRFGAALLLSVVDGAGSALTLDKTGLSLLRGPSDAAAGAVKAGADIAPVLRKPQGSEVAILVAEDLDFSGVYGVAAAR